MNITNFYNYITNDFIKVSRYIAHELDISSAVMLGELFNEYNFYKSRNKLNNNFFFSTVENIENRIGFKRRKQENAIRKLSEHGYIKVVHKGKPSKRYFSISEHSFKYFDNFETLNVKLAKIIGINEALLLSVLCRAYQKIEYNDDCINNGIIAYHEAIYFSINSIRNQTALTKWQQERAFQNLNDLSIINKNSRYVGLIEKQIEILFDYLGITDNK